MILADAGAARFSLLWPEISRHEVFGLELWRWLAFGAAVAGAWLGSRLVEWLANQKIHAMAAKTEAEFRTKLIGLMTPVIRWGILLVAIRFGLHFLDFQGKLDDLVVHIFKAFYALLIAFLLTRLINILLEIWVEKTGDRPEELRSGLVPVVSKLLAVLIFGLAILVILQNAGYNIGGLLAGLGIGGLAVALAGQETLANLFGTITIFADRPFRVGDRILLAEFDGDVERIGLRSTRLRLSTGALASIPNRIVAQSSVTNVSRRPALVHVFNLSLAYDTTHEKIEQALSLIREIYQKHPLTYDSQIAWKSFAPTALDFEVTYKCRSTIYREFILALEELHLATKLQLEQAGISLAIPTQVIQLQKTVNEENRKTI